MSERKKGGREREREREKKLITMQLVLSLLESGYGLTEGTQMTPTAARITPINPSTPYQIPI